MLPPGEPRSYGVADDYSDASRRESPRGPHAMMRMWLEIEYSDMGIRKIGAGGG
jgi:hypothetical protein